MKIFFYRKAKIRLAFCTGWPTNVLRAGKLSFFKGASAAKSWESPEASGMGRLKIFFRKGINRIREGEGGYYLDVKPCLNIIKVNKFRRFSTLNISKSMFTILSLLLLYE